MAFPGRTTTQLVLEILVVKPNITNLDPWISVANELVTELCTVVHPDGHFYDDVRLELIERWLAAHFYTVLDPRTISERAGTGLALAKTIQAGKIDFGLRSSIYGQNAMRLDTWGALSSLDNGEDKYGRVPGNLLVGAPIGIGYLGTDPCQSRRRRCFGWW